MKQAGRGPRPNRGAIVTRDALSPAPSDDPQSSSIIEILSMNEARDTRKWDSIAREVKRRVTKPRRQGLTLPTYPSTDEFEENSFPVESGRPLTAEEQVRARLEAQARRDYVASHVPITTANIQPFQQPDIQSNFCFKCWMLVASPPVGLSCHYCPVIAHRHCVDTLQIKAKEKLRKIRQRYEQDDMNENVFESSDEEEDSIAVDSEAAVHEISAEELNMKWVCPFCIEMLHDHNDYKENKEITARSIIEARKRSMSVAATARMFIARKRWIARVRNSIKIQRFLRARTTMMQLREELRSTKNVIRVGLHELELRLVAATVDVDPHEFDVFRTVGQFGSIMLPKYLKSMPAEKPELRHAIEVLRTCLPTPPVHLRPAEKAVSSNSLMLSVTVHDMLDGEKQIYRMDTPLVETIRKRKAHTFAKKQHAGTADDLLSDSLDDLSITSTPTDDGKVKSYKRQIFFRPQLRGVMMFPACHADVILRFTVTEVSKWPNGVALARAEMSITDYVLKRQAAVLTQRLESVGRIDKAVEAANFCRLNIANFRNSRSEPSRFVLGHGRLTWAFIPSATSTSMAGPLLLLPDVDSWGAKRRTWCVILEKTIYVYGSVADLVPKEVVDLSNCKVMIHQNEVSMYERT